MREDIVDFEYNIPDDNYDHNTIIYCSGNDDKAKVVFINLGKILVLKDSRATLKGYDNLSKNVKKLRKDFKNSNVMVKSNNGDYLRFYKKLYLHFTINYKVQLF